MNRNDLRPFGILGVVVAVWLIYLSIEVAKHVNAWPFG
jgi:uncharacterized membrane protein